MQVRQISRHILLCLTRENTYSNCVEMRCRLASFFLYRDKTHFMKLALFIIAALLAVAWIISCFVLKAGIFVHIFLITAALLFMQAIIINPGSLTKKI